MIGKARSTGDTDEAHAFLFCFLITLAQAVPWLFLAFAGLYLALALVTMPLGIAGNLVQACMQFIAYSNLPPDKDE